MWDLSRKGNRGEMVESCVAWHPQYQEASECGVLLTSVILLFLPVPHGVHNTHTLMSGSYASGVISSLDSELSFHSFHVILWGCDTGISRSIHHLSASHLPFVRNQDSTFSLHCTSLTPKWLRPKRRHFFLSAPNFIPVILFLQRNPLVHVISPFLFTSCQLQTK